MGKNGRPIEQQGFLFAQPAEDGSRPTMAPAAASVQTRRVVQRKPSTLQAFRTFHDGNPQVYALLVGFAREVKGRGWAMYSVQSLFERIRWHYHVDLEHPDPQFKLNNNYRPYYARLIMSSEPDLKGFFETRRAKADRVVWGGESRSSQ